jgi:glutamate dehydrogenase
MRRTRDGTAASRSADPDLDVLHRVYTLHLGANAGSADDAATRPGEPAAIVRAHRRMAAHRTSGESVVGTSTARPSRSATLFDVITDEMPFVVESLLAGLGRAGARVRHVVHPVVAVRRDESGALVEVLGPSAGNESQPGTSAELWIRVEVDPLPADEAKELAAELRSVLRDVRDVAIDQDGIAQVARSVAAELLGTRPPGVAHSDVRDAALLIEWLVDGRFALLGYRRDDNGRGPGAASSPMTGSGLGVLRREEVARRVFDGVAPGPSRDGDIVVITRASAPSRVFRPVHPSVLAVRIIDRTGRAVREHRFLGALTMAALHEDVLEIPRIGRRVRASVSRAGAHPESYTGRRMLEVIAEYPREELFWAGEELLHDLAVGVLALTQPRRLRLFVEREPFQRFFSCLVYLPRDRYSTRARQAMEEVLLRELRGWRIEHSARIGGESRPATVHFTVYAEPTGPGPDRVRLQGQLAAAILTWDEWLLDVAGSHDHEVAGQLAGVPEAYKGDVDPVQALADLRVIRLLGEEPELQLSVEPGPLGVEMRLRFFLVGRGLTLSEVLPVLHDLGVEVLDERPYEFIRPDDTRCWLYTFGLRVDEATGSQMRTRPIARSQELFCSAFSAAWRGDAESDRFSALVLRAGLPWREVAVLRGYARYARQLGSPYGITYMAETLLQHPRVASALVVLFRARFDPDLGDAERDEAAGGALTTSRELIDAVTGLDADRILRSFLAMITATLRTNWFRGREFFSFKLDPAAVPNMPLPRPMFEIFVYSPRMEGVHLRFGPVARGGLRWSDRPQDYRTEILGLVKAQAVKNAVIVPVGAKGGFVVRGSVGPDEVADYYRTFVRGLLDVTDNLETRADGTAATVPPQRVVRYDGDDSYLVVAADKGTATFSDIANEVAASYGFWLGDAFASGGSVGYDHKAMGITARGAWESVKRHFRELGVDTQGQEFTVVGIGDMSGDVFGNGMLLSRHIRMVAAFDHRHVFVDPTPDAARGFAERQRLFARPRSSWDDYDRGAISAGGGVWPRTTKSVPVEPEMRTALGIDDGITRLTPPELIRAILRAPADLLWNGGIGTYVKAGDETHSDAGDKANDAIRVDGRELRVKVVGEGGNLGLTQRGRIEFARAGGKLNTDAIDNSAGVDCSDHEVNIKILLDRLVTAGELTRDARNALLAEMTDEVADLVLDDNRDHNAVLGVSRVDATGALQLHARIVADLTARRGLDPVLEGLPDAAGFATLHAAGEGLSGPELAVLLAHIKLDIKTAVLQTDLPDLPEVADRLTSYFPSVLAGRHGRTLALHPLRREIVTTSLVNQMIDRSGLTYPFVLREATDATPDDALRAFLVTSAVYDLPDVWAQIDDLPGTVPVQLVDDIIRETHQFLVQAARWLLTRRPRPLALAAEIEQFAPAVRAMRLRLPELLAGREADAVTERADSLHERGVPRPLALRAAGLLPGIGLLDAIEVAERVAGVPLEDIARMYYTLSERVR